MTKQLETQLVIRQANVTDNVYLALLCQQLGYPTDQEAIQRRLNYIYQHVNHNVYVAELAGATVVGMIHVYVCALLEADPYTEIGGLVVNENYRCFGVGWRLMQQAEWWAREQGCTSVRLRSRSDRMEAHAFYTKLGYTITKTQLAFQKSL
jgi:GNAT superfamily N-acetyltransferase